MVCNMHEDDILCPAGGIDCLLHEDVQIEM